jgi:hypothetical protein
VVISRRNFIVSGFAALAAGAAARRLLGAPPPRCVDTGALRLSRSFPLNPVPRDPASIMVDGLPFHPHWLGDSFDNSAIPFHRVENDFPGGTPPTPSEHVDVAIIGGGLAGLATAYLLRDLNPVVLEVHDRFGGTAMGEVWRDVPYSLGGAYFITPDEGSDLEALYHELHLDRHVRVSPATDDIIELQGRIEEGFWEGQHLPPEERLAFLQYATLVQRYVDQYPSIPLDPDADNTWIRELDQITLRQHITNELTVPVPKSLAAAIQGYCYSSFGAGWEEISAASGWNFIAAEEFGRWVLPGGNAGMVTALWHRLAAADPARPGCPPHTLRGGCRAVDVRVLGPDQVRVTYRDKDLGWRSLIAKRVVMSNPKHIARRMLPQLADNPQRDADMGLINTNAYVVANVLLNRAPARDFYDMFLVHDDVWPPEHITPDEFSRATDALRGDFALLHGHDDDGGGGGGGGHGRRRKSVLTFYWPRPYGASRVHLIEENGVEVSGARFAPLLRSTLRVLDLEPSDVEQVRLARWGHAMPIAEPGLIASGTCERLRQPFMDHVYFVQSDNWALPAVETCLEEAIAWAPVIRAGL